MLKRILCTVPVLLTVFNGLSSVGYAVNPQPPDYDGYLVRIDDNALRNTPALMSTESSTEIADGLYLVEDLSEVRQMDRCGAVTYYEPNYVMEVQDYTPTQWNMLAVNAQAAWNHTDSNGIPDLQGDGVIVAVIDSGVYKDHPDFNRERFLPSHNLSSLTVEEPLPDGYHEQLDNIPHGTFVAGIIAAQVNNSLAVDGISPGVTLLSIRVTNNGTTNFSNMVAAIDYAVSQHADVINISIGGEKYSTAMEEACKRATDAGVLIVGAAGNYKSGSKNSNRRMYPASFDNVVSVSACKKENSQIIFDDDYSYFNDDVTVSAPGTDIVSLHVDGKIRTDKGTSFAAPVVSGLAAIAKQYCPSITPDSFDTLLRISSTDLGEKGRDDRYGYGLVNIEAFIAALEQSYTVMYELGADDAQFPSNSPVPSSYTLKDGVITLPTPERPGYHFTGWRESTDPSAPMVSELIPGSTGDKTFYASWIPVTCLLAQYTLSGQMISLEQLPSVTSGFTDVDITFADNSAYSCMFWMDSSGTPIRNSEVIDLDKAGLN